MFILAHLGFTLALFYVILRRFSHGQSLDYRLVLLGAVLPDLIDKFVGHVLLPIGNGRIFAHGLLFIVFLAGLGLGDWLTRRRFVATYASTGISLENGSNVKSDVSHRASLLTAPAFTVAIAASFHLFLDQMWMDPASLYWPALGWEFSTHHFDTTNWIISLFTEPYVYGTEILGALCLLAIGLQNGLLSVMGLKQFLRDGKLE